MTTREQVIKEMKNDSAINGAVLPFMLAQVIFESGNFESYLSKTHNNFSGITYAGQTTGHPTKGEPQPEAGGGNYARYDSVKSWYEDYRRILNLGQQKPRQATTPEEFVSRLKQNGYFTAGETEYLNGLKSVLTPEVKSDLQKIVSDNLLMMLVIFIFLSSLTVLFF